MKTPFRLIVALLAWITLIVQYAWMVNDPQNGNPIQATIAFFGYFTVLTNILVALALTAPFLKPSSWIRGFFMRPHVRAAIALYISVVAVVYHTLLSHLYNPTGIPALTDIGLHTLIPVLYLIDWIVFSNKKALSYSTIPYWVIYPLVYGVMTLGKGLATQTYPYPFLNVNALGYGGVALNMAGFLLLYAVGAAIFITVGKRLNKSKPP